MSFPNMQSLIDRAIQRGYRKPQPGETEESYRTSFADFMRSVDSIESMEIKSGKPKESTETYTRCTECGNENIDTEKFFQCDACGEFECCELITEVKKIVTTKDTVECPNCKNMIPFV